MTSPFHDDLYYVVEQIILIAVAFILLVLILLQLRAEQLQGAKVPISKYRIHRILLICFTLQAIRCIDPRGRYSILPLPLLGFVVVNQIPAVALCGSTFLASSVAALEQTSSTPVPRLLRILPIAAPIVTTSVFNILSILRFSLPLEWLEGVCYIYFAVFMVFGGASSIQFSAGRLQRVITTHIAAVDAANGETAASSVTDHQQEEMRKNYSALMLIRVVTGLQAVFIIAVVLLAGIQIVHKGAVHASSDTYEPIGQYLGVYFMMYAPFFFVWIAWIPLRHTAVAPEPTDDELKQPRHVKNSHRSSVNESRDNHDQQMAPALIVTVSK